MPRAGARSFDEIASIARAKQGVWVVARRGQATANLVTRIRQGLVTNMPSSEFEAVARTSPNPDNGGKYDIDVRWVGEVQPGVINADSIMEAIRTEWPPASILSLGAMNDLRALLLRELS